VSPSNVLLSELFIPPNTSLAFFARIAWNES